MASNEPSYWTLRRKAKDKVDQQLQTIQATSWGKELGCMQSKHPSRSNWWRNIYGLSLSCWRDWRCQYGKCSWWQWIRHRIRIRSNFPRRWFGILGYWTQNHTCGTEFTAQHSTAAQFKSAKRLEDIARNCAFEPWNTRQGWWPVLPFRSAEFNCRGATSECWHSAQHSHVELQVNIDGLPLYKSSATQFWPILGTLQNIKKEEPVTIGLFCGTSKPTSLAEYLQEFISEVNELAKGFEFEGVMLTLQLSSMVCDAPARAFLKMLKVTQAITDVKNAHRMVYT